MLFSAYTLTTIGFFLIFLILQTLLPVAFYTLLERKLMASLQRRRGPNVVGLWGAFQPIADGLKLLIKEGLTPRFVSISAYFFAPLWSLIVAFTCWSLISNRSWDSDFSLLTFLAVSSTGVYGLVIAGWASYSRYALMGAIRAVAQLISYEVVMTLAILPVVILTRSFNFVEIMFLQSATCWMAFPCLPVVVIFYVIILAETNRTPFDLPEAEAELVSGFNVEYSSTLFAMFFLAEYSNMILMSTLMVILFFGGWTSSWIWFFVKVMVLVISFVFIRALLPRYRYDQLMFICWRTFLPLVLGFLIFILGFVFCFEASPYSCERMFDFYYANSKSWFFTRFGAIA